MKALEKWKLRRLGIIDLGTNSVRFDVHEIHPRGGTQLLHREKLMVRLGERVFLTGRLHRNAVRRTLQAFSSFQHTASDLKVGKIVAFGTSALREAMDSEKLLKGIRSAVGIDVKVISGKEEAKLIAAGILSHEHALKGVFGLVDIGGGSTEISVCRNGKILHSESFALGVARLQQVFLKTSPPRPQDVRQLRRHIRGTLRATLKTHRWPPVDRVIGSSGTIRALCRFSKKHYGTRYLTPGNLKRISKQLLPLRIEQIAALPGMEPKRVDLILAGAVLMEEILRVLSARKASATDYSLRDGILDQELRWLEPRLPHSFLDLEYLLEKARCFGAERIRLKRLVGLSESVFHQFRSLHRLPPQWSSYLTIASLFRDAGRAVSPIQHELHSYYIVKHSDLPITEEWETELIAQLCLHHETGKSDPQTPPFQTIKLGNQRAGFVKLLALLRIVDALDGAYPKRVTPVRVTIGPHRVRLYVSRGESAELTLLRLHQRKALFENVFRRQLVLAVSA
jgi:exopolyphosphatase/guanosine-5'-triphosphate,3'-diphosphate pyrophosphatase